MREIKFRAWDKENKKWFTITSLDWYRPETGKSGLSGVIVITETGHDKFIEIEKVEVVEFANLKDKNGREIYESDYVRWDGGEYEIRWSGEYGWFLKDDREAWDCPNLYSVSSPEQSRIEVIGNTYEQHTSL